jgi:LuxR family glucitol operon transcriptional activator
MALEEDLSRAILQAIPVDEFPLSEDEKAQAEGRRASDKGGGTSQWHDLLYYLDLNQKLDILARHAPSITKALSLGRDVAKRVVSDMRTLTDIRNRVCHARPLEEEDLPVVLDVCKALLAEVAFPFDGLAREYQLLRSNQYPFVIAIPEFWRITQQRVVENLPDADFDDTGYIGREQDRQNLLQLLVGAHPVITVTGEGGIGKTALTVRCLYDLIDLESTPYEAVLFGSLKTNRLTPHGIQTIVDSASTEVEVLQPLLAQFAKIEADAPAEAVFEGLIKLLSSFRVLLVIDNIETIELDALRPLLVRIPQGSKIVLTSRIGLGEIEIRYPLGPLASKDAVRLFRSLARLFNMGELFKRDDEQIAAVCERLYSNPLLIRWFVEGYSEGRSIPELLNSRRSMAVVLDFCFQNVYGRFTDLQRKILQTLVIVPGPLSEVQLALLSGIGTVDEIRVELQYLYASNVVRRAVDQVEGRAVGTLWTPTDFARKYVNTKDNRPIQERQIVIQEYRALISARDQARLGVETQAFRFNVITAYSTDEATVVRLLRNAQLEAMHRDFAKARELVQDAIGLQPGFYEVWRVSAQVKDLAGDVAGAYDDFHQALDLAEGHSDTLLVFYSQFLRKQNDFDGALELLRPRAAQTSAAPQLIAEYAWLHLLIGRPAEAVQVFASISDSIQALGGREQGHYVTQYASALRRASEVELQRQSLRPAFEYVLRALQQLAAWSSRLLIDPNFVQEAQRCVQTSCRVVAANCNRDGWQELEAVLGALSGAFPLLGEAHPGSDNLIARCKEISDMESFSRLIGGIDGRGAAMQANRLRGRLKPIYVGRDYTFITGLDGHDYFVHRTQFLGPGAWEDLWESGSFAVEFIAGEQTAPGKSPRADAVRLIPDN